MKQPHPTPRPYVALLVLSILLLLLCPGSAPATAPVDPRELEGLLDNFFVAQMDTLHIPGVVVTVVKGGEIFFSKGYGFADLETKRPMIPDKTVIRLGSISKLFTATAIMQLVEQGKLGLDDDVNQFLQSFRLEPTFPEPVRVKHLLSHTGGFDERFIGTSAPSATAILPLGQYLAARMPPRVMPAGQVLSYSNHGMCLAGYLVELVSGQAYEQYVQEHILQPLEMHHTYYGAHLDTAGDGMTGYMYQDRTCKPQPYIHLNDGPAGAWDATATDMARFMIAHLQLGQYKGMRILQEGTARAMQQEPSTYEPRLGGFAYGFFLWDRKGIRLIGHNGGYVGFFASMTLIPEEHLGVFFAVNQVSLLGGPDVPKLEGALLDLLLERYFPTAEQAPARPLPGFRDRADQLVGDYRQNRYPRGDLLKLMSLLLQLEVSAKGDTLLLQSTWQPEPTRWVEVDSLFFRKCGGVTGEERYMAFRRDERGHITHMLHVGEVYDRIPWYEVARYQLAFLGTIVLVFLSTCVVWPASFLIRRRRRKSAAGGGRANLARWVAGIASGLNLVFLVGLVLVLAHWLLDFFIEVPMEMVVLLTIPILTSVLAVGMAVCIVLAWKDAYWGIGGRLHYTATTLAAVGFIWFLNYWNLLGFHF